MKTVKISAVAHDGRALIQGQLSDITVLGCQFETPLVGSSPDFPRTVCLTLELLDESRGVAQSVPVVVRAIWGKENTWIYRLSWRSVPELLKPHAWTVEESLVARQERPAQRSA